MVKRKNFLLGQIVTLLHSERPKLYIILVFLSAIGLKERIFSSRTNCNLLHSERPKLYIILVFLSAIGLKERIFSSRTNRNPFTLRKTKIVYHFSLFECNRVKRKNFLLLDKS